MLKTINFTNNLKKCLIISACIMLVGIILTCIFGVKLDTDFAGGSVYQYSFTDDVNTEDIANLIKDKLGATAEVSETTDISGNSRKIVISFSGDITNLVSEEAVDEILATTSTTTSTSSTTSDVSSDNASTDASSTTSLTTSSDTSSTTEPEAEANEEASVAIKDAITAILKQAYPDNAFELADAKSVNPSLATSFLVKSLVAVIIAAAFVVLYIAIRFRKIGGVLAALSTLVALVHDVIIAFFSMAIFGLSIDINFFAVVLMLFGYSLNATIVMFDRVRENKKFYPELTINDGVNKSINETLARSIMTTLTTVCAITAIIVVGEIFGITTLRTFAIPMAFGLISGCYTSVFLSGPIWVKWNELKKAKSK